LGIDYLLDIHFALVRLVNEIATILEEMNRKGMHIMEI
jgi:hypothetical protein